MLRREIVKIVMLVLLSGGLLIADQQDGEYDFILKVQNLLNSDCQNNPLMDKKYGIEANILRLFYMDQSVSFSGGFSLFDVVRNAEISFPVYYEKPEDGITTFTVECHYRHFLNNSQSGPFIACFSHLAGLEGAAKLYNEDQEGSQQKFVKGEITSHLKLGVGIGIGFRRFSQSGIYWGCSLNVGRYILGENDVFYHDALVDSKYILSAELLKFGVAF